MYENPHSSLRRWSSSTIESTVPISPTGTCSASSGVIPNAGAMAPAMDSGSSVNTQKPTRACSSMSPHRSPALTRPLDLLRGDGGGQVGCRLGPTQPVLEVGVDADDVGFPSGDAEHAAATAADDERRMRMLHGLGRPLVARDGVVLALEGERPVGHQPLDDGDALLETVQAHAGRVVGHARAFVVAAHPPGTQAELE